MAQNNMRKMFTEQQIIDLVSKNLPIVKEIIPEDDEIASSTIITDAYYSNNSTKTYPQCVGHITYIIAADTTYPVSVDEDGLLCYEGTDDLDGAFIQKILYI